MRMTTQSKSASVAAICAFILVGCATPYVPTAEEVADYTPVNTSKLVRTTDRKLHITERSIKYDTNKVPIYVFVSKVGDTTSNSWKVDRLVVDQSNIESFRTSAEQEIFVTEIGFKYWEPYLNGIKNEVCYRESNKTNAKTTKLPVYSICTSKLSTGYPRTDTKRANLRYMDDGKMLMVIDSLPDSELKSLMATIRERHEYKVKKIKDQKESWEKDARESKERKDKDFSSRMAKIKHLKVGAKDICVLVDNPDLTKKFKCNETPFQGIDEVRKAGWNFTVISKGADMLNGAGGYEYVSHPGRLHR